MRNSRSSVYEHFWFTTATGRPVCTIRKSTKVLRRFVKPSDVRPASIRKTRLRRDDASLIHIILPSPLLLYTGEGRVHDGGSTTKVAHALDSYYVYNERVHEHGAVVKADTADEIRFVESIRYAENVFLFGSKTNRTILEKRRY